MILLLIGFLSGIISGMGIGGGTVLIPAMVVLAGTTQHVAQGLNLAFFIPTGISAIIIHAKRKLICFKTAFNLIITGVIGAVTGSVLASYLTASLLRKVFGVFLLIMGIYELMRKDKTN